jgi:S-adenosylmethionine hydrolase
MASYDWVTFTSDYGLQDNFVGVCHGVIARIAPAARVIDVTHEVAAQDVRQGATVLAQSVPYLPAAVHLAVVDPGVGTGRGQLAVEAGGHVLIGPDNGLLLWAADALGGVRRAHAIANPAYRLEPVSRTFHGRDLFAPAAAHVAAGTQPAALGPELDPGRLVRIEPPEATLDGGRLGGEIVLVDRFGNLALSLGHDELERSGLRLGDRVEVKAGDRTVSGTVGETFAAVEAGELVLYEDSFGRAAVSVNHGSAAEALRAAAGDHVVISKEVR